MKLATTLTRTLLADKTFDIEFRGYLSNHAKHAMVALDRLHAPPERIQGYWDEYTSMTPYNIQLHAVNQDWDKVKPSTAEQWAEWRGCKVHWQEQVAFMNSELQDKFKGDTDELVRMYAPSLLSGTTGALTHGIIHLGWAIDAESPWMICEGLAYLNFCHLGVDPDKLSKNRHADLTPMDSFVRVAKTYTGDNLKEDWVDKAKAAYDESYHPELVPAGFQWQLAKVVKDAHSVATELPNWLEESSIDELWQSLYRDIVYLYLATRNDSGTGNFLVLHLLSSLWALEQVCRVVDSNSTGPPATVKKVTRPALQQYYASSICILAASGTGFPSYASLEKVQTDFAPLNVDPQDFDWNPIVKNGIAETEEHNIKLVYVMKELWHRYGRWNGFSEAAKSFTTTPNIGPDTPEYDA